MGNYESRKRTKPCASCKLRRLKCQYQESLPCERCVKHGIACFYPATSLHSNTQAPSTSRPSASEVHLRHKLPIASPDSSASPKPVSSLTYGGAPSRETNEMARTGGSQSGFWNNSVDQRLNILQNAVDSIATICQNNNAEQQHQVGLLKAQLQEQKQELIKLRKNNPCHTRAPTSPSISVELPPLSTLMKNNDRPALDQGLNSILTIDEANELIHIFTEKMIVHMLGYQFYDLSAHELWYQSPILLLAISAVACPHHPRLASKQVQLVSSLKWHCTNLLNDYDIAYETRKVEHTILALIIGALWLESSQMYMSVALHLARIWRIDRRHDNELWRLWCLLYVTDGTQNLVSQKSPAIYKQLEPVINSVRQYMVAHIEDPELKKVFEENENDNKTEIATNKQLVLLNEVEMDKIKVYSPQLQDIKLCGLVEYHMAIETLFHDKYEPGGSIGSVRGLLQPSNFGIPWENNLDLDKWMVSWAIALQNIDMQEDAWCLKSTLLYYNFARMHINTGWMLERRSNLGNWMQVWHSADASEPNTLREASQEVSLSAAISLLKLATRDKDVSSLFRFLPSHVYVMLFFASMIVLNFPLSSNILQSAEIKKLRQRYNLVRTFKEMLEQGPSSNHEFTFKIASNLSMLMKTFTNECMAKIKTPTSESRVEEIINHPDDNCSSKTKSKPILAWPSVNHGHP
ncbi:uncharacterized protein ZBIST_3009 [Zygosaccharomyces bailii]|nr:uncharacterized protein ZBIST_3009 [Zygosaccharomyces bailii]